MANVVGDAIRSSFARTATADREQVKLPTFDGGGLQPGVDLDDSAALLEVMESN